MKKINHFKRNLTLTVAIIASSLSIYAQTPANISIKDKCRAVFIIDSKEKARLKNEEHINFRDPELLAFESLYRLKLQGKNPSQIKKECFNYITKRRANTNLIISSVDSLESQISKSYDKKDTGTSDITDIPYFKEVIDITCTGINNNIDLNNHRLDGCNNFEENTIANNNLILNLGAIQSLISLPIDNTSSKTYLSQFGTKSYCEECLSSKFNHYVQMTKNDNFGDFSKSGFTKENKKLIENAYKNPNESWKKLVQASKSKIQKEMQKEMISKSLLKVTPLLEDSFKSLAFLPENKHKKITEKISCFAKNKIKSRLDTQCNGNQSKAYDFILESLNSSFNTDSKNLDHFQEDYLKRLNEIPNNSSNTCSTNNKIDTIKKEIALNMEAGAYDSANFFMKAALGEIYFKTSINLAFIGDKDKTPLEFLADNLAHEIETSPDRKTSNLNTDSDIAVTLLYKYFKKTSDRELDIPELRAFNNDPAFKSIEHLIRHTTYLTKKNEIDSERNKNKEIISQAIQAHLAHIAKTDPFYSKILYDQDEFKKFVEQNEKGADAISSNSSRLFIDQSAVDKNFLSSANSSYEQDKLVNDFTEKQSIVCEQFIEDIVKNACPEDNYIDQFSNKEIQDIALKIQEKEFNREDKTKSDVIAIMSLGAAKCEQTLQDKDITKSPLKILNAEIPTDSEKYKSPTKAEKQICGDDFLIQQFNCTILNDLNACNQMENPKIQKQRTAFIENQNHENIDSQSLAIFENQVKPVLNYTTGIHNTIHAMIGINDSAGNFNTHSFFSNNKTPQYSLNGVTNGRIESQAMSVLSSKNYDLAPTFTFESKSTSLNSNCFFEESCLSKGLAAYTREVNTQRQEVSSFVFEDRSDSLESNLNNLSLSNKNDTYESTEKAAEYLSKNYEFRSEASDENSPEQSALNNFSDSLENNSLNQYASNYPEYQLGQNNFKPLKKDESEYAQELAKDSYQLEDNYNKELAKTDEFLNSDPDKALLEKQIAEMNKKMEELSLQYKQREEKIELEKKENKVKEDNALTASIEAKRAQNIALDQERKNIEKQISEIKVENKSNSIQQKDFEADKRYTVKNNKIPTNAVNNQTSLASTNSVIESSSGPSRSIASSNVSRLSKVEIASPRAVNNLISLVKSEQTQSNNAENLSRINFSKVSSDLIYFTDDNGKLQEINLDSISDEDVKKQILLLQKDFILKDNDLTEEEKEKFLAASSIKTKDKKIDITKQMIQQNEAVAEISLVKMKLEMYKSVLENK